MADTAGLESKPGELTAHRKPLHALTGIRFFAAGYVVIFHSQVGKALLEHGHRVPAYFFLNGFLAVPLFFILSGFILAYTYEGQIETGQDRRRFWEARFARIWPAYMVSQVAFSLPQLDFPSVGGVVTSALMLQAWMPWNLRYAGIWNAVCWTLSAEALFYLIFPWVQAWLEERRSRTQGVALVGLLLICVVCNTSCRSLFYQPEGVWRWIPLALVHVPEFLVGVVLGNAYLRQRLHGRGIVTLPGRGVWTYGAAAVSLALLCVPVSRWTSLVMLGFAPLLYGLAAERTWLSRLLSTRFLLLGGGVSYSMYLMQMVVKAWVIEACARAGIGSQTVRQGLTAMVLLGVAYAMFRLVENPARLALRSVFAGSLQWRAVRV